MLHLRLKRTLPEGRLHQDLRPELEARRRYRNRHHCLQPDPDGVHRSVDDPQRRRQRPARGSGGQGQQRLHQAQTGDGDPERREAPQGGEDPAQQEDGALLRTGAGGHYGGHQAGLWGGEEALHAGREAGGARFYCSTKRSENLLKSAIY